MDRCAYCSENLHIISIDLSNPLTPTHQLLWLEPVYTGAGKSVLHTAAVIDTIGGARAGWVTAWESNARLEPRRHLLMAGHRAHARGRTRTAAG